jgi:zinc/manganese transport system permease protein
MDLFIIVIPAFIAGLLIALTHGLLGVRVLSKGIIFMDLAIAQIAGFGLLFTREYISEVFWVNQLSAVIFAMIAAYGFYLCERFSQNVQEAIIGCSFILCASLSMLLLANHPHGGDEVRHLLSGQILFTTFGDLAFHSIIYVAIIFLWFYKSIVRDNLAFYLIFAIAITSSVQLVGVYVVFASLILPAIAAVKSQNKVLIVWLSGVISVTFGIISSIILDLPSGLLIVLSYFLLTLIIIFYRFVLK